MQSLSEYFLAVPGTRGTLFLFLRGSPEADSTVFLQRIFAIMPPLRISVWDDKSVYGGETVATKTGADSDDLESFFRLDNVALVGWAEDTLSVMVEATMSLNNFGLYGRMPGVSLDIGTVAGPTTRL